MNTVATDPCGDGNSQQSSETVLIAALVRDGSPRSAGEDPAHIQLLMEAEGPLPPVVVHRPSMRLVDGFHRVAAALNKGRLEIEAEFIDGSEELAFIVAVEANVKHGLPLSLADRRAATAKILSTHHEWSDRAIATCTGMAPSSVAALRLATSGRPQSHTRLGIDGRLRPLNAATGRERAAALIASNPNASLRQIAQYAGISVGTVRNVRERLRRGEDPVPERCIRNRDLPGEKSSKPRRRLSGQSVPDAEDISRILLTLSRDPALRMSDDGRKLLRWLHRHAVNELDAAAIADSVPEHWIGHLVDLATQCSINWMRIADELSRRSTVLSQ